ncbi:hypothetical protein JCM9279_007185 [Rhodotorula babjevae]
MARSKPRAALQPSRTPSNPALAPSSSSSPSSTSPRVQQPELVPVRHYLPRVPLQLFAVAFSLVAASTSQGKALPSPARFVHALVRQPLQTLPVVCAALAAIQTWFAYSLRSNRLASLERAKHKGAPAPPAPPAPAAASRGTGFRGSLGTMWDAAMRGEAPTEALWKKRTARRGSQGKAAIDTSFVGEAIMVTWLGTLAIHACTVLLGAPLYTNLPSTYLFSLLVSILAILPLAIALPLSDTSARFVWLRLASTFTPADDLELALFAPALGTLAGAWLGAVPIPLDWDRPWQQWPTTPVLGALAGHALGSLVALARIAYGGIVRAAVDVLEEAGQQQQQQQRGAEQAKEGARRKIKGQ